LTSIVYITGYFKNHTSNELLYNKNIEIGLFKDVMQNIFYLAILLMNKLGFSKKLGAVAVSSSAIRLARAELHRRIAYRVNHINTNI